MNIVPLSNHVVVKRESAEEVTPGGIVIPDVARQEKPSRGKVLAVGPGKRQIVTDSQRDELWVTVPLEVKEGQTVLFTKYAGNEIELDGEKLTILTEDSIMAIVS